MSVITYYLGAGASANCIPVNKKFPRAVINFANNFLTNARRFKDKGVDYEKLESSIDSFKQNVISNPTVDIFALKLLHQDEPELLKWFKNCLELFFLYCQYINPPDYRYEFFLSSFIKQGNGVPILDRNVNVITWNYDNQLELAFSRYINYATDSSLPKLQEYLRIYPFFGINKKVSTIPKNYNIVKLNGGVGLQKANENGYYYSRDGVWWHSDISIEKRSLLSEGHAFPIPDPIMLNLLTYYNNYIQQDVPLNPYFTYSWEGEQVSIDSIKIAKYIANKTKVLVLCGYSFPFVNSKIDKEILSNMHEVDYVYYQDYEKDDDLYLSIETRLRQLIPERDIVESGEVVVYPRIRRIKYTNEFYIPPDLELE